MTDLPAQREAVAKIAPCPKCSGAGFLVTNSSHAEHDAGCDGSCRNCPVEVPDQDISPCDCEFAQANLTEADLWRLASALPALLDELEAARANYSDIAELLFGEAEYEHDDVRLRVVAILDELEALTARQGAYENMVLMRDQELDTRLAIITKLKADLAAARCVGEAAIRWTVAYLTDCDCADECVDRYRERKQ